MKVDLTLLKQNNDFKGTLKGTYILICFICKSSLKLKSLNKLGRGKRVTDILVDILETYTKALKQL